MDDPWDVKSVRLSEQYVSCMKINGVPLLPPVLSKGCRKEMQYYKLLAKEVEKRIRLLIPYVNDSIETDSIEDKTDAPDLPQDCELFYDLPKEDIQNGFQVNIEKITAVTNDKLKLVDKSLSPDLSDTILSAKEIEPNQKNSCQPPKFLIDLSLNINENGKHLLESVNKSKDQVRQPTDPPERDYNNTPKKRTPNNVQKELLLDTETYYHKKKAKVEQGIVAFNYDFENLDLNRSVPFPDMSMEDGPQSLSCKSFTGSLNNIHRESIKESQLVRQRSYTVLNPSPMLLAHLHIQSLNTGVEVNSISMSESGSCLYPKKRRSWDLESAKVKWSSMALELKQKTSTNMANPVNKNCAPRTIGNKTRTVSPQRAKLITQDKNRRGSLPSKAPSNSEPNQRFKNSLSPVKSISSNRTIVKGPVSKSVNQKYTAHTPNQQSPVKQSNQTAISEANDPAARVRELYEKIQNQQLTQMANLVEKQKREQLLLQQVFEEQNSILYKQLKTICPKSPIEVKEAWSEKVTQDTRDSAPVSLSQLINPKTPDRPYKSPTSTLTDTHSNLNKCDMILKKSKDLTASIKKQLPKRSPNKPVSPKSVADGNRTRTHSPSGRNVSVSRKLNYDTSPTDEKELEYILTDRTNDTMAELNSSFPTDSDEPASVGSRYSERTEFTLHRPAGAEVPRSYTDSAIRSMEETIHNSMNTIARKHPTKPFNNPLTPKQLGAAATIVAYAKGFLVRRLMRTERVQATVQTIKDALLCALQLHQDRAGIRGADVDLHRRLIQQITAACYSLHDAFVASTPAERCALIAADRERRRQKPAAPRYRQKSDIMTQSHSGSFPARAQRPSASLMTQSNYETFSGDKVPRRYVLSPRRRPWR